MMNTTFLKKLTVVLTAVFFASCDKDYNSLGSDIIGNENFLFNKYEGPLTVKAYNQKVDYVQTNNLALNKLGIYNHPVFGKTEANFVTQLNLGEVPVFKTGVQIDSVILTVPYFSKKIDEVGARNLYKLDSIYTNNHAGFDPGLGIRFEPINLKVYENGYYLNDFDPNNVEASPKYYSDQNALFDGNKIGAPLNDYPNPLENTAFEPNPKEFVKYKVDKDLLPVPTVDQRFSPRMRLHLNQAFFKNQNLKVPASIIVSNNAFKNYFRGLYFKVESASKGTMMSLDFAKGDVTIYYKQDSAPPTVEVPNPKKQMKSLALKMSAIRSSTIPALNSSMNTVNMLDNDDNPSNPGYSTAINNLSTDDFHHPSLYLKGGRGSQVFIDLFTEDELKELKKKENFLVNQANLIFYIDQDKMYADGDIVNFNDDQKKRYEPRRLYLYDAENNVPLADYGFDSSTNSGNSKLNKTLLGGIIKKKNGKGVYYKINITEHVNNLINKGAVNVRLALIVAEDINVVGNYFLKTPINNPKKFDRVPVSSVINPIGTILHGSNLDPLDANYDKRVKFEIYYTKPN